MENNSSIKQTAESLNAASAVDLSRNGVNSPTSKCNSCTPPAEPQPAVLSQCSKCKAPKINPARKPVVHILGLFHTCCTAKYSHCAFTGKALRLAKMLKLYGYKTIEYSNGASESEADEKVMMLTEERLLQMITKKHGHMKDFVGKDAIIGSPAWCMFNGKLMPEICKRAQPGDIVAHVFGKVHPALADLLPFCYHLETGIGYPDTWLEFRIFESSAWYHYHMGKECSGGKNYNWIAPNYYDLDEWPICEHPASYKPSNRDTPIQGPYVLFFGRIDQIKGLDTIVEIGRRIDIPVVICGQGDPEPWLKQCPKLIYIPPISGRDRAKLLGNALCCLMPTIYIEPFGGSGVEGMLCGTPLLAPAHGAFLETVIHGVTGFHCSTLGDWLDGIKVAHMLDRKIVAERTRARYSLEAVGKIYDTIFKRVQDLAAEGWYGEKSFALQGDMARKMEQQTTVHVEK